MQTYKNKSYLRYEREQRRARTHPQGLVEGTVIGTASGRLFFRPDGMERDYPVEESRCAILHGDRARARCSGEGCVVMELISHARTSLTGIIRRGMIIPDEKQLYWRFSPVDGDLAVHEGDRVVASIVTYPDGWEHPTARVTEVLGRAGTPSVDVMAVVRRFGIADHFPDAVRVAAEALPSSVSEAELAGRLDLRGIRTFTIDGAHSKDFDDAVSIAKRADGGYRLGVHIADVNAYVQADGVIDREARSRGTSVYFADRVVPMLPESLSNGICSLNEGVDRLTLSCLVDVDAEGTVVNYQLRESVIRSCHRLVYDDMNLLLAGDAAMLERYADIVEDMETLRELHEILLRLREERGYVDFDVPESEFTFDEQGHAIDVKRAERGVSERIIESCMLLANETVARHMKHHGLPCLYRVHEVPEAEKAEELTRFLRSIGMRAGVLDITDPHSLQDVLAWACGKPEEGIVSTLLLRSMQRARYCPEPLGHYGLALEDYCHFTSPIRRYPDLFVHRALKASLHDDRVMLRLLAGEAQSVADASSHAERNAMEAERAVDDCKCCEYLSAHIGEPFDGTVSGVGRLGLFVALDNTAEGLIRMASLPGDRWKLDTKGYCIRAERSGKVIRMGDRLRVQVARADMESGEIDLLPLDGYNKKASKKDAGRKLKKAPVKKRAFSKTKASKGKGGRRHGRY